jgi:hypothetical protein
MSTSVTTLFSDAFPRLKDFRGMGVRYEKLTQNSFSALCFVATLVCGI